MSLCMRSKALRGLPLNALLDDDVPLRFFLINNICITFTIRTNNTYNTLDYSKRKKIQLHFLL